MLNGQKVVKVFTHEEKSKEEFNKLNDMLNDDMYKANKYANILMPIANNLGNLQYVLIATVGTIVFQRKRLIWKHTFFQVKRKLRNIKSL